MKTTRKAFQLFIVTALVAMWAMPTLAQDAGPADLGTFTRMEASPDNARGGYQQFYFTFEHRESVNDIDVMRILFATNKEDRTGIYFDVNIEGRVRYGINGRFGFGLDDGNIGDNKVIDARRFILDLKRSTMTQIGNNTFVIALFIDFRDKEFSGRKRIYLGGRDIDIISSEFVQRGVFTVTDEESEHTPEWISMSPDDEEGRGELFSFVVEDKDGAEDISRIYIKYSRYKNSYYGNLGFTITPATREIAMGGGGLRHTGTFGDDRLMKTPAGILDLGESSLGIDRLGKRYVVKLKLRFKNSNVGEKKFWAEAVDTSGRSTDQKELGKYLVAYSKSAPHPMFVLPANVKTPAWTNERVATSQVYSFWWRDSDGLDDIKNLQVKFAAKPDENDERVQVDYTLEKARLVKSSKRYYGAVSYGGGQSLESDYAILYGRRSDVTRIDDYTARIDLEIAFKDSFAGKWNIYLRGEDKSGNQKGWRRLNRIQVTTSDSRPSGRKISPFFSTALNESYLFEFQDPDGANDIDWAEAEFKHVGDDGTFRDSFMIRYTQNDRALRLFYAGRVYQGTLGQNKTIGNEGVHIDLRKSFILHYQDRLQLFVSIKFDNGYIWGLKNILLWARDYTDNEARRRPFGGIDIPADR